jgi:hypothetical protein
MKITDFFIVWWLLLQNSKAKLVCSLLWAYWTLWCQCCQQLFLLSNCFHVTCLTGVSKVDMTLIVWQNTSNSLWTADRIILYIGEPQLSHNLCTNKIPATSTRSDVKPWLWADILVGLNTLWGPLTGEIMASRTWLCWPEVTHKLLQF